MATIQHLMAGIHNLDYVLPEFQREYVWELVLHHGSSANALVPRRVLVQPTGG